MANEIEMRQLAVAAFRKACTVREFASESYGGVLVRRHPDGSVYLSEYAARLVLSQLDGNGRFIVMLRAVLMEDEGKETVIQTYSSRADAQAWIDRQRGQYHGPGDYYIATP